MIQLLNQLEKQKKRKLGNNFDNHKTKTKNIIEDFKKGNNKFATLFVLFLNNLVFFNLKRH